MFDWIKSWAKGHSQEQALAAFCREHELQLNEGRLIIKGSLVSDFIYLLRFYSNGKFNSFEDFTALHDEFVALDGRIFIELQKPVMQEQAEYGVARATAEGNSKTLREILRVIASYVDMANIQGLPPNPLLEIDQK